MSTISSSRSDSSYRPVEVTSTSEKKDTILTFTNFLSDSIGVGRKLLKEPESKTALSNKDSESTGTAAKTTDVAKRLISKSTKSTVHTRKRSSTFPIDKANGHHSIEALPSKKEIKKDVKERLLLINSFVKDLNSKENIKKGLDLRLDYTTGQKQVILCDLNKNIHKFEEVLSHTLREIKTALTLTVYYVHNKKKFISLERILHKLKEGIIKNQTISQKEKDDAINRIDILHTNLVGQEGCTRISEVLKLRSHVMKDVENKDKPLIALIDLLTTMHSIGNITIKEDAAIVTPKNLMLTYPSFTTSFKLFETIYRTLKLLDKVKANASVKTLARLQQKNIVVFLRNWIKSGIYETELSKKDDPKSKEITTVSGLLQKKIIPFVEKKSSRLMAEKAASLKKSLQNELLKAERRITDKLKPAAITTRINKRKAIRQSMLIKNLTMAFDLKNKDHFNNAVLTIANDFRCIAKDNFGSFPLSEILFSGKKDIKEKAPGWDELIEQNNVIQRFVEYTILKGVPSIKFETKAGSTSSKSSEDEQTYMQALQLINFFAEVALKSLELHDYNTAYAIFVTLEKIEISRLHSPKTKKSGDVKILKKIEVSLEKLGQFFVFCGNFPELRKAIGGLQENNPENLHIIPTWMLNKDITMTYVTGSTFDESGKYNVCLLNLLAKTLEKAQISRTSCNKSEGLLAKPKTSLSEIIKEWSSNHDDPVQMDTEMDAISKKLRIEMNPQANHAQVVHKK